MAINYVKMRETAVRLITENGRAVVIRARDTSAYDPVTGTGTTAYVDIDAMGVFVSITAGNAPTSEIRQGDKIVFVTQSVKMADMIVDSSNSEQWQVIEVDEYYPGPLKLVWKCVVRK
jgi:hypothetical protein